MTNEEKTFAELFSDLEWYQEAGVDLAVGEVAIDWINAAPVAKAASVTPKALAKQTATNLDEKAKPKELETTDTEQVKKLVSSASNLAELEEILKNYDGCALKKRAANMVFGVGSENAKIMFVGKAPSRDDDLEGQIFVGKAGALLDKMMGAIGLGRSEVYLSNILPWRPPGDRAPTLDEINSSMPFFIRQVELVAPDFIFMLGEEVAQIIFEKKISLKKLRSNLHELKIGSQNVKAICSFRPEFLLNLPAQKRLAWQDLLLLKSAFSEDNNE